MDITKEAYNEAIRVLEKCVSPNGFYAAHPGYHGVWSRDSVITSLGASLVGNKFKTTFANSLKTLAKHQSAKGQIANAVLFNPGNKIQVDFQSIDSSLWYVIGHYVYKQRYKDSSLMKKYQKTIDKALEWLSYQDMGEDGMLEQLPTTDWQDAFPHRYGHTINTQALHHKVLSLINQKAQAKTLKKIVNLNEDKGLWQNSFYLSWRWKNHGKFHEKGEWFDTLGNLLAIVFDLADTNRSQVILNHIKRDRIDHPVPIKAMHPPIWPGSKDWQDYFLDCEARSPFHYLNGGVWTFIGGFYILALIKEKRFEEAEIQLKKLAEANMQHPYFSEWLNGKTGKPGFSHSGSQEGNQAWNAGMYILAYESFMKKKVLI